MNSCFLMLVVNWLVLLLFWYDIYVSIVRKELVYVVAAASFFFFALR